MLLAKCCFHKKSDLKSNMYLCYQVMKLHLFSNRHYCKTAKLLTHTHMHAYTRTDTHSPRVSWQNGAALVEWFTCWTGRSGFESHHFSLRDGSISQKVIKWQHDIQTAGIVYFYDFVQADSIMCFSFSIAGMKWS